MEAIECAGSLRPDEAVPALLDLEANSNVQPVSVAAIAALSNYGDAKRVRVLILKTLLDDLRKGRQGTDTDARERSEVLAGGVVRACNKLTGRNASSPEEWFKLVDEHKTDLDALFGGK
jgi:hypothetical protein